MSRSDKENGLTFPQTNETAPETQNKAVVTPSTTSNEEMSISRPKDVTEGDSDSMEGQT